MREAQRKLGRIREPAPYRNWSEYTLREILDQAEIRSALMWRSVYIKQDQLINPARLVDLNLPAIQDDRDDPGLQRHG
jgi:hypothetical protein